MVQKAKLIGLFAFSLVLIFLFQNCAQEDGLPVNQDGNWNVVPTPAIVDGDQCNVPSGYKTTTSNPCTASSMTFSFADMPTDANGKKTSVSITVPENCTQMVVNLWGAGGGATSDTLGGGFGAKVAGTVPVGIGEVFQVVVGEGGKAFGDETFGGGGSAGKTNSILTGGSSGGGRSAILRNGIDIVTAGGGGGAGINSRGGYSGITTISGDLTVSTLNGAGIVIEGQTVQIGGVGSQTGTRSVPGTTVLGGSIGSSQLGVGYSGVRFKGGNGGDGAPGAGGGGGGYYGGGGGASSGVEQPSNNKNYGGGGGAGSSYIGCGNLTATGVYTAYQMRPGAGYNSYALVGSVPGMSGCSTASRGGGVGFHSEDGGGSIDYWDCSGVLNGSHGYAIIEWK